MKNVVLIDDEPNYCFVTKERLEDTGEYHVTTSNNADDGLAKIRKMRPDIILLDLVMPVKNGLVVAMELKKRPDTRDIPIIFLSGMLKEDMIQKNRALIGDDNYVSKTENIHTLIAIMDKAIAESAPRRRSVGKQRMRIVTYLPREDVDFLDKIGKDVLFARGFKLSRSEALKQLVEFLKKMNADIAGLDLANNDLSTALFEYFKGTRNNCDN